MAIQVVENENCKFNVSYVADSSLVSEKYKSAIKYIRDNKTHVKGFRPGLAPEWAIKKNLKGVINKWMEDQLLFEAYSEFCKDNKFKIIGSPVVSRIKSDYSSFECDLIIFKKPEVKLNKYTGFEIPSPHLEATVDQAVEQMIQTLRMTHAEFTKFKDDDFVQDNDKVNVDFSCHIGDDIVESATRTAIDYNLGLSKDEFFTEMDCNIVGMKVGESKEFNVVFGNKTTEDLRNSTARVCVTINSGFKVKMAALDNDLSKKVGFDTFEEMRDKITAMVSDKENSIRKQLITEQLVTRLLAENSVDVPEWMVIAELNAKSENSEFDFSSLDEKQADVVFKQQEILAKLSLILEAVREAEPESVCGNDEILNVIKSRYSRGEGDPETFINNLQDYGLLERLSGEIKNEIVLDWLINRVVLVD